LKNRKSEKVSESTWSDAERFHAMEALRDAAWKDWENKAFYDWRVTLFVWAGFLLVAGFLAQSRLLSSASNWIEIAVLVATALILLGHFAFIVFIHRSLDNQRERDLYWRAQMECTLPEQHRPPYRLSSDIRLKAKHSRDYTPRIFQVLISIVLFGLIVLVSIVTSAQRPSEVGQIIASTTSLTSVLAPAIVLIFLVFAGLALLKRRMLIGAIVGITGAVVVPIGLSLVSIEQLLGIDEINITITSSDKPDTPPDSYVEDYNKTRDLVQCGEFGPFPIGQHRMASLMDKPEWRNCIKSIQRLVSEESLEVLYVIGSADRTPLHTSLRSKYGTNFGLASARANWILQEIINEFPTADLLDRTIVLTGGPAHVGFHVDPDSLSLDRIVRLLALSLPDVDTSHATGAN